MTSLYINKLSVSGDAGHVERALNTIAKIDDHTKRIVVDFGVLNPFTADGWRIADSNAETKDSYIADNGCGAEFTFHTTTQSHVAWFISLTAHLSDIGVNVDLKLTYSESQLWFGEHLVSTTDGAVIHTPMSTYELESIYGLSPKDWEHVFFEDTEFLEGTA